MIINKFNIIYKSINIIKSRYKYKLINFVYFLIILKYKLLRQINFS